MLAVIDSHKGYDRKKSKIVCEIYGFESLEEEDIATRDELWKTDEANSTNEFFMKSSRIMISIFCLPATQNGSNITSDSGTEQIWKAKS
ncbi:hypothetical protein WA026_022629 [Henosepilachna vigintioctopunctata]|uniref:Uncharacterized protein n=1 Tax=Henosepilachna vigintioctopunctata TaxID=420089 RepID=A0AAW1UCX9_9CUCU